MNPFVLTELRSKGNAARLTRRSLNWVGGFRMTVVVALCGLTFQAQSLVAAPPAAKPDMGVKALKHKAETAIVSHLVGREATLTELIKEISEKSGIKIVYASKKENDARITAEFTNIPASDAIRYVTELSSTVFTYKKDGVYIRDLASDEAVPVEAPKAIPVIDYATREWKIPPNFPVTVPKKAVPPSASEDLAAAGIVFPPASMAVYSEDRSRLTVRNTKASLNVIDALVRLSEKKAGAPASR